MTGQPESTERCAVCLRVDCATLGKGNPAHKKEHHDNWARHWRLGYELKVRALTEAEKERDDWKADRVKWSNAYAAAEERAAQAERERDVWKRRWKVASNAADLAQEASKARAPEAPSESLLRCRDCGAVGLGVYRGMCDRCGGGGSQGEEK